MQAKDKQLKHLTESLRSGKLQLPVGYTIPTDHGHKTSFKSIRKSTYRGKAIRVETTYKVIIDNEPITSHTTVLDDGSVHCHDFPNYSFSSAVDMAKKIVDSRVEFDEPKDELSSYQGTEHGGDD